MRTWIQRTFEPLRRVLPASVANIIRSTITAGFTPFFHYYRSGHLRSSFAMRAVDRFGRPLTWYSYPCIDFLKHQSFADRHVLEFGAGQSTYWWASVAASVIAIDADERWFKDVQSKVPPNVSVHFALSSDAETCVSNVQRIMAGYEDQCFDIIVIDGLYRAEMIDIAIPLLNQNGAIICDNSEGYGFFEGFQGRHFQRVDFYGAAPGNVLQGCTSIFFKNRCFLFDNSKPIASHEDDS
jgi:hypothetical protein